MWMKPDPYLKRLIAALEQTVAPELDDDHVRGQLYAVTELIAQLFGKLEYRRDLVLEDWKPSREALHHLLAGLADAGAPAPQAITAALAQLDADPAPPDLDRLASLEALFCDAIDHLHAARPRAAGDPARAAANRIDHDLRDYLTRQATREIGRMKPPALDKISRSKKPERKK